MLFLFLNNYVGILFPQIYNAFLMDFLPFYSIHRAYCLRQGITSPISDLTERLLLEERDPPATPQDILYEAPPFDEVRFYISLLYNPKFHDI
jgi:hypothetical protein